MAGLAVQRNVAESTTKFFCFCGGAIVKVQNGRCQWFAAAPDSHDCGALTREPDGQDGSGDSLAQPNQCLLART